MDKVVEQSVERIQVMEATEITLVVVEEPEDQEL